LIWSEQAGHLMLLTDLFRVNMKYSQFRLKKSISLQVIGPKTQIINSKRRKMSLFKNITGILIILLFAIACEKEIDNLEKLNNVTAPVNVTAFFDITQDNSGLVTIVPGSEGAVKYLITFGDTADEIPTEYGLNETITHTYTEGVYTVGITAVGITGLSSKIEKEQPQRQEHKRITCSAAHCNVIGQA